MRRLPLHQIQRIVDRPVPHRRRPSLTPPVRAHPPPKRLDKQHVAKPIQNRRHPRLRPHRLARKQRQCRLQPRVGPPIVPPDQDVLRHHPHERMRRRIPKVEVPRNHRGLVPIPTELKRQPASADHLRSRHEIEEVRGRRLLHVLHHMLSLCENDRQISLLHVNRHSPRHLQKSSSFLDEMELPTPTTRRKGNPPRLPKYHPVLDRASQVKG